MKVAPGKSFFISYYTCQPAAREELSANLEGFLPITRFDGSGSNTVRQVDYQVIDRGHAFLRCLHSYD